ncbi:MAG: hypothetical protein WBQ94_21080, partial [Terracidiphilus sp.]
YGLTPKQGTLGEMAAARKRALEEARYERRLAVDEQRAAAGKPRRLPDPQLMAVDELLRLAGVLKANPSANRLRSSVDRRVGRHATKIAKALTGKAVKGDMRAMGDLLRMVGLKS